MSGNPGLVGQFHDVLAGDLRFPAQHVQPHILDVSDDRRFASRIVAIEQIGRIDRSPHEKILSIHLEVKVAAFAELRELLVLVAMLGDDRMPKRMDCRSETSRSPSSGNLSSKL